MGWSLAVSDFPWIPPKLTLELSQLPVWMMSQLLFPLPLPEVYQVLGSRKTHPKKMHLICLGQQPLSLSIKVFITAYKENESNLEEEKSPQSKREKALGEEYHQIWVIILPQDLVQRGTVINFPCKCTREQNVYKCIVGVQWRVQEHFFDCVSCGFLTHTITIFWLPWHICLSNVLLYFWQLVTFPFQSARFVQKLCVQWRN